MGFVETHGRASLFIHCRQFQLTEKSSGRDGFSHIFTIAKCG